MPISLVRLASSVAPGFRPTFFAPRDAGVVADGAEHMGLFALFVDGAPDGLAVDGDGGVRSAVGLVPGRRAASNWSGSTRMRTLRMADRLGTWWPLRVRRTWNRSSTLGLRSWIHSLIAL